MDLQKSNYKCLECGVEMVEKTGKFGPFFACPEWDPEGDGCPGHVFYPPNAWRVASRSTKGRIYSVKEIEGKLYCDCMAGMKQRVECNHKKRVREAYNIDNSDRKALEEMFNSMKDRGFFKDYNSFSDWEKSGRK